MPIVETNQNPFGSTKKTDKIMKTISSNFGWFGLVLIAVAYLSFSLLTIEESQATFWQILARTGLSFFVGFSINRMLDIQGMNAGFATEGFQKVDEEYLKKTQKVGVHRKKLHAYCKYLNKEALKNARETLLSYVGLDYDDYFDKKAKFIGTYFDANKKTQQKETYEINKSKNENIKKAIKHKVTQITPSTLLSDDVRVLDSNYLGKTIGSYTRKTVTIDVFAKLLPALIFGRLAVAFSEEAAIAGLLLALVEIGIYVLLGLIKFYMAYRFVTKEYSLRILNKTSIIEGLDSFVPPKEVEEDVALIKTQQEKKEYAKPNLEVLELKLQESH